MKILQLGKFYPVRGGVEKVMRDLTEGLSDRGVLCDMLCARMPDAPEDPKDAGRTFLTEEGLLIQLNEAGRIICVKAFAKLAGTMISPAMVRYLKRHCGEYDLIHIHHPDPMAALALRLSGYKGRVMVHWHSDILSQRFLLLFYKPLQNWLLRRAERIIGTTPVYVKESPHLRKFQDKCTYLPIGVEQVPLDEKKVARVRSAFPSKYLVLSVGRMVPYKGYRYLIEAMSLLPETYELHIVGDGPLYESLRRLVIDLHLEHRVSLPGYLPDGEEFHSLFGACDVFVLPSVMKTEAFGIVQIEAMSCHKPVVATRIPGSGVSWVNLDGVSGINVDPCNPWALSEAIQSVTGKNGIGYGERAYKLYKQRYTLKGMIKNVMIIYGLC